MPVRAEKNFLLFRTMCALDPKLAGQNGAKRSFELTISDKQLLCDVARTSEARSASAHDRCW